MNRLTKAQKEKIGQFRTITGASEKVAYDGLSKAGWSQDLAVEQFNKANKRAVAPSKVPPDPNKALNDLYASYQDAERPDFILADGMVRLCEDLGVDPADAVMLVVAYKMKAATMCEFSKEEFTKGMVGMGADGLPALKRKLPELRRELHNESTFRDIYNFAYHFACEKGHKCVQLETACAMWQLLLGDDFGGHTRWPLLDKWLAYLTKHHSGRAVSKDTWEQLLDFVRTIQPDFSNFDPSGAWPFWIDEFVEHLQGTSA